MLCTQPGHTFCIALLPSDGHLPLLRCRSATAAAHARGTQPYRPLAPCHRASAPVAAQSHPMWQALTVCEAIGGETSPDRLVCALFYPGNRRRPIYEASFLLNCVNKNMGNAPQTRFLARFEDSVRPQSAVPPPHMPPRSGTSWLMTPMTPPESSDVWRVRFMNPGWFGESDS